MTLKKFCSLFFATSRILFSADLSFYDSFKMVPLLDGRDLWGNYCIQPTMVSENGLTKKDYTDRRVDDIESFFRNIQENWKTLNRQDVVQQFSQVNQLANAVHFSALHFFEMVLQSTHISEMKIEGMERQNRRAQLFHRIRELKGSFIASQQSINKTKNVARINTVLHMHSVFNALLMLDGVKEGDYDLYAKRIVCVLVHYCGKNYADMMKKFGVGLFYRYSTTRLETPLLTPLKYRQFMREKIGDYRREIQFYLSLSDTEFDDFCHYILQDVPFSHYPVLTEAMRALHLLPFKKREDSVFSIYLCDDTTWEERLSQAQQTFDHLEHRRLQGEDLSSLIPGYWRLSRDHDFLPANVFLRDLFGKAGPYYDQEWGIFFSMEKPQTIKHMQDIRRAAHLRRMYYLSLPERNDADFIDDPKDPIVLAVEDDLHSISSGEHAAAGVNASFPSQQPASVSSPHSSVSDDDDEEEHHPLVSRVHLISDAESTLRHRFEKPKKTRASLIPPGMGALIMFEQGQKRLQEKHVEEGLSLMEEAVSAMPLKLDWKETFLRSLRQHHHTLCITSNSSLSPSYVQWLESIAQKYADYELWRFLGKLYEGIQFDGYYHPQKAMTAYQNAIDLGDSSGLSHLYLGRHQLDKALPEGVNNLRFAAQENLASAKFALAMHYLRSLRLGDIGKIFTEISDDGITYDDRKIKSAWVQEAQNTLKEGLTLLKEAHDAGHLQGKMVFALYYGLYLKSNNQTTMTRQHYTDLLSLFTDASRHFNIALLLPEQLSGKPCKVAFLYPDIQNPLAFPLAFCFEDLSTSQWDDFQQWHALQKTHFQDAEALTVYKQYNILTLT